MTQEIHKSTHATARKPMHESGSVYMGLHDRKNETKEERTCKYSAHAFAKRGRKEVGLVYHLTTETPIEVE